MIGGRVVHRGRGGPGNAATTPQRQLERHLNAAAHGCPSPRTVVACVAGAGLPRARRRVERVLAHRFPAARRRVYPDYVAAWAAAPPEADVAVIVGTGSVVCSRRGRGGFAVSGGRGWLRGDHGSAVRLGEALVRDHCRSPRAELAAPLGSLFGSAEPAGIAAALSSAETPQLLLARAAPLLTAAAATGEERAVSLLESEMLLLARTIDSHLGRHHRDRETPTLALSGGVASSLAARAALARSLHGLGRSVAVVHVAGSHAPAAARLASELCR